jgi:uncharacterized protein YbjT (DUF2867 family)
VSAVPSFFKPAAVKVQVSMAWSSGIAGITSVMITPRWVRALSPPIALDNLLYYLLRLPALPEARGRIFEAGGPEHTSYADMMRRMARAAGQQCADHGLVAPRRGVMKGRETLGVGDVARAAGQQRADHGLVTVYCGVVTRSATLSIDDAVARTGVQQGANDGFMAV